MAALNCEDEPMARAWVELSQRWGPRQVLVHRLREAGYAAEVEIAPGGHTQRALLRAAPHPPERAPRAAPFTP